jgi:hypothetical protein
MAHARVAHQAFGVYMAAAAAAAAATSAAAAAAETYYGKRRVSRTSTAKQGVKRAERGVAG